MVQRAGALLDQGFELFVCESQPSFAVTQGFLRQPALADSLAQCFLRPLALGDIVEAVDRSCDLSSFVPEWSDIHDGDNPGAVRPFNMHLPIMDLRHLAS